MTCERTVRGGVLLKAGNITLNRASLELHSPYGSFQLPNKEYQMPEMLLRTPSSLIPAERFLEAIWGYDAEVETNVVVGTHLAPTEEAVKAPSRCGNHRLQKRRILPEEHPMINRLRRDLLTAAMLSLGLAFAVIIMAASLSTYWAMTRDADALLTMLAENGGTFPDWESQQMKELLTQSPEVLFTCRYFSAVMSNPETVISVNTEKISADAAVLEMEYGENEWLQDIQVQIARLTALTNDLIYLSKMEEGHSHLQMAEFSLSGLVNELAQSYQALAKTREKYFASQIQLNLTFCGDERAICQAVSNLLDNALKYSGPKGSISLTLQKRDRAIHLEVFNTTAFIAGADITRLFDRFYWADPSRNSQTGGHGIGLFIVKAVVSVHKGEVSASSKDGQSLLISVTQPGQAQQT